MGVGDSERHSRRQNGLLEEALVDSEGQAFATSRLYRQIFTASDGKTLSERGGQDYSVENYSAENNLAAEKNAVLQAQLDNQRSRHATETQVGQSYPLCS